MKNEQDADRHTGDTFTIDGAYFREQTREAMKLFFAPLSGVYRALHGRPSAKHQTRA